jgi:hypothetical protein
MELTITLTVRVPNDISPKTVLDEITSNVESIGWAVVKADITKSAATQSPNGENKS